MLYVTRDNFVSQTYLILFFFICIFFLVPMTQNVAYPVTYKKITRLNCDEGKKGWKRKEPSRAFNEEEMDYRKG